MIVASHGSLANTNPWLEETIQSMAYKIVHQHPNHKTRLQATIRSSRPVRGEHEIKLALQVSKLVVDVKMLKSIIMSHQWLLQEQGLIDAIRFMWII